MHQFVKEQYDSIWGYGIETDDMVARYWKQISDDIGRDEVMIVSIDKVLTFSGSKGNFRKLITPKYKANRKKQELPPY